MEEVEGTEVVGEEDEVVGEEVEDVVVEVDHHRVRLGTLLVRAAVEGKVTDDDRDEGGDVAEVEAKAVVAARPGLLLPRLQLFV